MEKKAKNILIYAASLAALMLTASCNKEINEIMEEPASPTVHSIEVTVPVATETKASYTGGGAATTFEAGDKLYIKVRDGETYTYVGVLDNSAGAVSTFTGTLNKTAGTDYSGSDIITDCTSLEATLLPNGYDENYYVLTKSGATVTGLTVEPTKAFSSAATKAAAVPQVANASYSTTGSGAKTITLTPQNAVLYYTLSGLTASTSIDVTVSDGSTTVSGSVTADGSGTATFAVGIVPSGTTTSYMMTKGGDQTIEFRATLSANNVYNITRSAAGSSDCLSGVFSVASGKTVKFSKGNLKATLDGSGNVTAWSFHDTQHGMVNTAAGTQSFTSSSIDLFGWSTSATLYGINSSTSSIYSGSFLDWGAAASKDLGYGWRTLTGGSGGEWEYLFNTRSASTVNGTENARFAKAYLFGTTHGIILFPDEYSHPDGVTAPTGINATSNTSWNENKYAAEDWAKMEAAGAVFLPAAGTRNGTDVSNVGSRGYYWSSTATIAYRAYGLYFDSSYVLPANDLYRCYGYSVRLVQNLN